MNENDIELPLLPDDDAGPPLGLGPQPGATAASVGTTVARGAVRGADGPGAAQFGVPARIELPPTSGWQGSEETEYYVAPDQNDYRDEPAEYEARIAAYLPPPAGPALAVQPTVVQPTVVLPPTGPPPTALPPAGPPPEGPPTEGVSAAASTPGGGDVELDLFSHLVELRTRLMRAILSIGVAMLFTWHFRETLVTWFSAPIAHEIEKSGGKLIVVSPMEGFSMYLTITFIAAVIIAIPFVLWQLWAFVEPALTHRERRYTTVLVPFSVLLFFTGGALGFVLTPLFFRFFLQFTPKVAQANWSYALAATLLGKMLLCFGICFQVPVVTVFLNKTGIISRNWMIEYWRHVVIVLFVVVAIITPTWDPLTLCVAATPPCLLYGFSIWLVKWLP